MKKSVRSLIPLLTGAAAGFTAAMALGKLMSRPEEAAPPHHAASPLAARTAAPAMSPFRETVPVFQGLPSPEAFRGMTAPAKVNLAAGLGTLTPAQREAALLECVAWPEAESRQMLELLLSRWAETDPAAAADWSFLHLGDRALNGYSGIAQTWAAQDGPGLAAWAGRRLGKEDSPLSMGLRIQTLSALARFDPVAAAQFLELDCNRAYSHEGANFSSSLRTPEAVKVMASRLPGHVEYLGDLEELNRQLSGKSSSPRNRPSKNGWNALFEQTAVALHRISPQDCATWLATFPENAQLVARHEIAKAATPVRQPAP